MINIKHPGALHRQLKVPKGKKIPYATLESLKNATNPLTRKRATFAINARSWNHSK
jgi:hypothetical protein